MQSTRAKPTSLFQTLLLIALLGGTAGCGGTVEKPAPSSNSPTSPPPTTAPSTVVPETPTAPATAPVESPSVSPPAEITLEVVSPERFQQIVAQQRGKVVVVDFWATWCAPCVKQFPHTVELAKKHADRGLVAMSMSFDELDNQPQVLEFLKSNNATFTNMISVLDGASQEQMTAFEIGDGGVPCFKIYDRQGKLRKTYNGNPKTQGLDTLLEELLAEPAP